MDHSDKRLATMGEKPTAIVILQIALYFVSGYQARQQLQPAANAGRFCGIG